MNPKNHPCRNFRIEKSRFLRHHLSLPRDAKDIIRRERVEVQRDLPFTVPDFLRGPGCALRKTDRPTPDVVHRETEYTAHHVSLENADHQFFAQRFFSPKEQKRLVAGIGDKCGMARLIGERFGGPSGGLLAIGKVERPT